VWVRPKLFARLALLVLQGSAPMPPIFKIVSSACTRIRLSCRKDARRDVNEAAAAEARGGRP
jgi:hypothetical protein